MTGVLDLFDNETTNLAVKQPYVILLAISKYGDDSKKKPKIRNDIKDMEKLFLRKFEFEHVFRNLDQIHYDEKIVAAHPNNLNGFFKYHAEKIKKTLEEKDKKLMVDGFIFIYAGFGDETAITCSDGKSYSIGNVFDFFNNDSIPGLSGKPKIFISELYNTEKEKKKSFTLTSSVSIKSDMVYWYAESTVKSLKNAHTNGYFLQEIYRMFATLLYKKQKQKLTDITKLVLQSTMNASNGAQVPVSLDQLTQRVYLLPSNSDDNNTFFFDKEQKKRKSLFVRKKNIGNKFKSQSSTSPKRAGPKRTGSTKTGIKNNTQKEIPNIKKDYKVLLKELDLAQYTQKFEDEGYEKVSDWRELTMEDLVQDMQMKKGHAKRFLRFCTDNL